ncbi:MAG: PAS domain S-box protein [Anaerolineaceae bacterium]|nr:PAS domain S-box protein [Anaerolineaceae bacterium]
MDKSSKKQSVEQDLSQLRRKADSSIQTMTNLNPGNTLITARISRTYEYLSISPDVERLSGIPAYQYIGKSFTELPLLNSEKEKVLAEIEKVFSTGENRELITFLEPDQRRLFWVFVPMLNPKESFEEVAVTIRATQTHLNETCFRELFEQSPIGICFIDQNEKFLNINPALLTMLGYSKEELLSKTMIDITHPEDVNKSINCSPKSDKKKINQYQLEKRYIRKNGQTMWARVTASAVRDGEGTPLYQITVIEDVTENYLANQALGNERILLNAIMDSTADAIYIKDTESRFVRVNKGILDKYSLSSPEQILGKTDFDFFPGDLAQQDFDDEKKIVHTGEPLFNLEGIEIWNDRPPTWVSTTKVAVRDHEGKIIGTLGISRDITDRKQKEEEILLLNKSLEKKVEARTKDLLLKNKELEEFTYTVSHDLKAPLRGISGYSTLLLQEHADQLDNEGKGFLEKLILSSEQLSCLIDDLLTYSRLEKREVTFSTISVQEIVKVNLDQFRSEINSRNVLIHMDMTPTLLQSSYDLMMTIVHNYLDNALKFTSGRTQPEIWIEYRDMDDFSLLSFRDNGIGFDNTYAEKIFEVFQRLNHSGEYSGTGIGLAIVKKAADLLNYQVWAEGKVDIGATFYLKILHQKHL